jgi:protein-L-isoaspartate(D-aspartate) O-methyltransferase
VDLIEQAFGKVNRTDFLTDETRSMAEADMPLPIGYGQTNSQPTTVRLMLEWLGARPGDKVLDVGSGSGWTAALLAHIVGPRGKVYGVERIPELVEFGQNNIENAGIKNARVIQAGAKIGLPEFAPYDRILVSASADRLPQELISELKPGGKIVVPVNNSVWEIHKNQSGEIGSTEHPGFAFVPLI